MTIGAMRERIDLLIPTRSLNSFGEETTEWNALETVWAEIEEKPGTTYLAGPLPSTHKKMVFTIHRISGLMRGMRVIWKALTFTIEDIIYQADGRAALQAIEEDA